MKSVMLFIVGVIVIIACCALSGWIVSLLWNWLAPLFWSSAPILTVWQAFGILLLLNIIANIFKGDKK